MNANVLGLLTVVVGVPLNLYVTVLLVRLHTGKPSRALRVLIVVFLVLTLLALVFGLVFVNNDLPNPPFDTVTTKIVTRVTMLAAMTVPAVVLLLWLHGGSGSDEGAQ